MHRGHDHDHALGTTPGRVFSRHRAPLAPGAAADPAARPLQWQAVHLPADAASEPEPAGDSDVDLVEAAFVRAFADANDPTSFLRLAGVPFQATAGDGKQLVLLRVEIDHVTDIGAVMPHLGGESVSYNPLPAKLVAHRRRLRLIYFDGKAAVGLDLREAQALASGRR